MLLSQLKTPQVPLFTALRSRKQHFGVFPSFLCSSKSSVIIGPASPPPKVPPPLLIQDAHTCLFFLHDVPDILGRIAELSTGYAGAETEVADTDRIVLERVCEVVLTFSHCTDEDADALLRSEIGYIVCYPHYVRIMAERDFAAIWWEMVGDWILDHFEKLFLRIGGADAKPM